MAKEREREREEEEEIDKRDGGMGRERSIQTHTTLHKAGA